MAEESKSTFFLDKALGWLFNQGPQTVLLVLFAVGSFYFLVLPLRDAQQRMVDSQIETAKTNAAANQLSAEANKVNAEANKVNAEANKDDARNSDKILDVLTQIRDQRK